MHVATTKCVPYLEDGKVNSQSEPVSPSLREAETHHRRQKRHPLPARARRRFIIIPSSPVLRPTDRGDTAPTKEHRGVGGPAAAAGRFESQFMRGDTE